MAKAIWKQKREELKLKMEKTVKECYEVFIHTGDTAQCAGCPLGLECARYNKKARQMKVELIVETMDPALQDRNIPYLHLDNEIKAAIEGTHTMVRRFKVKEIKVTNTWWL